MRDRAASAPVNAAEDLIVCNLTEALTRLRDDLDRVELWTAALGGFRRPVPDYQPGEQYLLPTLPSRQSRQSQQGRRGGS